MDIDRAIYGDIAFICGNLVGGGIVGLVWIGKYLLSDYLKRRKEKQNEEQS